jgi:hypothetical protein
MNPRTARSQFLFLLGFGFAAIRVDSRLKFSLFHFGTDHCIFSTSSDILPHMKKHIAILVVILFSTLCLFAADLSGTWNAKVELDGGQSGAPTFVLKQEGEKLTGTYSGALGDAPLQGTVKGDEVVFDFEVSGAKIHYSGKVDKDGQKMQGNVDYGGQASGTFTATKNTAKK